MNINTVKLARMILKFGEARTEQGILLYESEDLEVGIEVFVESDGDLIPAQDGEYNMDGTIIVVEAGKIAEIRDNNEPSNDPNNEPEPSNEPDPANLDEDPAEMEALKKELEETKAKLEEANAEIERLNAELEKAKTELDEANQKLEMSKSKPAHKEFKEELDKDVKALKYFK